MKLFPVFLLLSNLAFGQVSNKPHGTLISAAICKDGIVMYADSRAAWTIDSADAKHVYACTDRIKKIFKIGNFYIGIAGSGQVNDDTWGSVIDDFNKRDSIKSQTAFDTFNKLYDYVKNRFRILNSVFFKNYYCIAGYEGDKPIILKVANGDVYTIDKPGFAAYSDEIGDLIMIGYKRKIKTFDSSLSQTIKMLDTVYKYACMKYDHIGGPIYSLKIQPKMKVTELTTFKPLLFKTYTDYVCAILNKKLIPEYFYEWGEELLFDEIRKEYKNCEIP